MTDEEAKQLVIAIQYLLVPHVKECFDAVRKTETYASERQVRDEFALALLELAKIMLGDDEL